MVINLTKHLHKTLHNYFKKYWDQEKYDLIILIYVYYIYYIYIYKNKS